MPLLGGSDGRIHMKSRGNDLFIFYDHLDVGSYRNVELGLGLPSFLKGMRKSS